RQCPVWLGSKPPAGTVGADMRTRRSARAIGPGAHALALFRLGGLDDLVRLVDIDVLALRRPDDLPSRGLLLARAVEVRAREARHRVADVTLVVDRQVPLAFLVDVGELAVRQLVPLL